MPKLLKELKKVISYDSIYIFSSVDAVSVRHYVCVFSRKSLVILTLSFGRASKRQRSCYHTYVQVATVTSSHVRQNFLFMFLSDSPSYYFYLKKHQKFRYRITMKHKRTFTRRQQTTMYRRNNTKNKILETCTIIFIYQRNNILQK